MRHGQGSKILIEFVIGDVKKRPSLVDSGVLGMSESEMVEIWRWVSELLHESASVVLYFVWCREWDRYNIPVVKHRMKTFC